MKEATGKSEEISKELVIKRLNERFYNPKDNAFNNKQFRKDLQAINFDLSNAELSKSVLHLVDLSDVNLSGANLKQAWLTFSNLSGANLTKTNLWNSQLSGANLRNAVLIETDLDKAGLIDTDLTSANIQNAKMDCLFCYTVISKGQEELIEKSTGKKFESQIFLFGTDEADKRCRAKHDKEREELYNERKNWYTF